MPKVRFLNEVITVEVPQGSTLREVAMEQGIQLYRGMWTHVNCQGNGICGRCRVWVVSPKNHLSHPSMMERFHRVKGTMRLACQLTIQGDIDIRTRPIGPATIHGTPSAKWPTPSYKEIADQRYLEAKETEKKATETIADRTSTSENPAERR